MRRLWIGTTIVAALLASSGVMSALASARITPKALTANTTPKVCVLGQPSCGRSSYVFTTTGKLFIGDNNYYRVACTGGVAISFERVADGKTERVAHETVPLRPDCTYVGKTTIPARLPSGTRLRVVVRFLGNDVIAPIRAPVQFVSVKSGSS